MIQETDKKKMKLSKLDKEKLMILRMLSNKKEINKIKSNAEIIKKIIPNRTSQLALRKTMSGMNGRIERQRIKSFEDSLDNQNERMNFIHKKITNLNKKSQAISPFNISVFPNFNFNKEDMFQNKLSKEINMFNQKRWRKWHIR